MMTPADLIGQPREALDTPVLLLDLDTLDRNIDHMARVILREAGVRWRPHTKGMKTPALAYRLQRAGATGITCAKLGEAEALAAAGLTDILIANQVVGPQKAARLARIQSYARVISSVDSLANATELGQAAGAHGTEIPVVVELNVGMNRAGVEPGEPAVALAEQVAGVRGLRLMGLMTWEAPAAQKPSVAEKRQAVTAMLTPFTETAVVCRERGLNMEIVSCGGTITYWMTAFHPGITEIQAGGGVYGDVMYCRRFGIEHEFALTVMTTVTSRPTPTRIITDAGLKTMTSSMADPLPLGIGEVSELKLSAEHGTVTLTEPSSSPAVGDRLEFVVGYSDTTVALHDEIVVTRNGVVEAVWPLLGRGRLT